MFFQKEKRSALEAKEWAQYIAFAPIMFQAARSLRNLGILEIIKKRKTGGMSIDEVATELNIPIYGVRVLMEAGLGIGLLFCEKEQFYLSKTGFLILSDSMTIANMDFVHDVCYEGMFELEESVKSGKPEGLKVFGNWNTVYEALAHLPADVQKSWFAFDHFYSDTSFSEVLPYVFKASPKKLLDIGGNTGKWALQCLNYSADIHIGIVDLPGQLNVAKKNLSNIGFAGRVSFYESNILQPEQLLPKGYDIIWMSQFLDCFSEEQIISILKKCREALEDNGHVFILEPFWDKQKYEAAAFSLQMTSLYFTNIANGNSQMYDSSLFRKLVEKAGFRIDKQIDNIGISHTILRCSKGA